MSANRLVGSINDELLEEDDVDEEEDGKDVRIEDMDQVSAAAARRTRHHHE